MYILAHSKADFLFYNLQLSIKRRSVYQQRFPFYSTNNLRKEITRARDEQKKRPSRSYALLLYTIITYL